MNYYNEFDPYAAQWLRNLILEGLIPKGTVDERSIKDVDPAFLEKFTQCHFFAGIGGWPLALRLAGWPDDRPVWTGSCPCQPFSAAGRQKGVEDERDLWPVWDHLIAQVEPPVIFGEQVSAAIGHDWLDRMRVDMEAKGYALGAAVLPACAVDAPHRRDRLWFVADTQPEGREGRLYGPGVAAGAARQGAPIEFERPCADALVADTNSFGGQTEQNPRGGDEGSAAREAAGFVGACDGDVADANGGEPGLFDGDFGEVRGVPKGECRAELSAAVSQRSGETWDDDVGDTVSTGLEGHTRHETGGGDQPRRLDQEQARPITETGRSAWSRHEWIVGADGKARRVEPTIRLLAHGVPARVGKLRAFGNAIVPQVAAEFIAAYIECR